MMQVHQHDDTLQKQFTTKSNYKDLADDPMDGSGRKMKHKQNAETNA